MAPSDWQEIGTAPEGRFLALSVIDRDGVHQLVFACRRVGDIWVNAVTGRRVHVQPTHWRYWPPGDGNPPSSLAVGNSGDQSHADKRR